ncbi:MAG TPA: SseB family protein [Mucilaginibacter sp.]|jgi:hypothetical protein
MGFFNKKQPIEVSKPIVNPALKKAIKVFNSNKSEKILEAVASALKKANFLVLINSEKMKVSQTTESNNQIVEKGSVIEFLKTFDENNDSFLPIFTDWNEVDLWIESRENIAGWIMTTTEVFSFVVKNKNDKGLVINPCSDRWAMDKEQITNFLTEG